MESKIPDTVNRLLAQERLTESDVRTIEASIDRPLLNRAVPAFYQGNLAIYSPHVIRQLVEAGLLLQTR